MRFARLPGIPPAYSKIEARTRGEPFSPSDVRDLLGQDSATYLELSRLYRHGWLFRLSRGRYATVDPVVRITPGAEAGLRPFRSACFYPILYRAVGRIIRFHGPRLLGIALFGSAARGKIRPTSDLDLFVLVDRHEWKIDREVDDEIRMFRGLNALVTAEWNSGRHMHDPSTLVADPRSFETPGPIMLGVASDARILYDPRQDLHRGFGELRRRIRGAGAREYRMESGKPYWFTGTLFEEAMV